MRLLRASLFLLVLVAAVAGGTADGAAEAALTPNILIILADDPG